MTPKLTHTPVQCPGPFHITDDDKYYLVVNEGGHTLAKCAYKEYAEQIKIAVNAHEELIKLLKLVLDYSEPCQHCDETGIEPHTGKRDACHDCGGTGKLMKDSLTAEFGDIEKAIAKAEGK